MAHVNADWVLSDPDLDGTRTLTCYGCGRVLIDTVPPGTTEAGFDRALAAHLGGTHHTPQEITDEAAKIVGPLHHRIAELEAQVAAMAAVHAEYFDLQQHPFDSTPEPEDIWRFDLDFRKARGINVPAVRPIRRTPATWANVS